MRISHCHTLRISLAVAIVMACFSCSVERHIADGELYLSKVRLVSDNANVKTADLYQYCRQKPNSKWLSTFKVPLGMFALSGTDTTKWVNRTLQRFGEKPVILDDKLTGQTINDLTYLMYNRGYLNAEVDTTVLVKGKKATLTYHVKPHDPYRVRGVAYDIDDENIRSLVTSSLLRLRTGQTFSVNELNEDRKRIVELLHNNGFYLFNKEYIRYDIDSSQVDRTVYLTMHINQYRRSNNSEATEHPYFTIRNIVYDTPPEGRVKLRRSVIDNNTAIRRGDLYSATQLQKTYNNFSRLQAVRYTSIRFDEVPDSQFLDCHIQLSPNKPHSLMFQPEGTNTAGDLGAAASLTYQNRNLMHGSEVLSLSGRLAYEAIRSLEGYEGQDYIEYGVEANVLFPRVLFPFVRDSRLNVQNATTDFSLSYNLQNRPEFHRRLFNAAWRYKWSNSSRNTQYKLDLIDINYLWMPWISETFRRDYLESASHRNVILRYNYEDLLIMKLGFGYTWSRKGQTLRINAETSGNLLNALSHPLRFSKNGEGYYQLLGIAYAQYAKGDIDYTRQITLDERNALVFHGRVGVAYPYGNSTVLPFEKRYFSGGANSLRGWSVRSLGPGSYRGKDGRIDFINQTGDLRLDLNAELRSTLFWKVQGAVFVDAGNIWTLRSYKDQPGGQFELTTFWKQIAANYGIGFRLNLDYFVVRFDMGMKAVNPAYESRKEQLAILYPDFKRDFAFHFAVGMPF